MNKVMIASFIKNNMEPFDFTGGVNSRQINSVQDKLGVALPDSYRWFLSNFGSGGLFGVDILGIAKSNIAPIINETKVYRKLGLDSGLVVIENMDEYAYCLNTKQMKDNECPVIAWDKQGGIDNFNEANNFYEFLWNRLNEAKKSWEEGF